jgi:saccharopine dehydrogenase-like NADP-dependent oxidoreductase
MNGSCHHLYAANKHRGVLLALRNAASFYQGGKVVNVAGPELMAEAKPYPIYPGFAFVAYPNRDSTPYKERYINLAVLRWTKALT